MDDFAKFFLNLLFVIGFIVFIFFRGVFVSKDVAERSLHIQGYSNIEVIDKAWFLVGLRSCGANDAARFTATATNPIGNEVELYVCSGVWFKGATIRTP